MPEPLSTSTPVDPPAPPPARSQVARCSTPYEAAKAVVAAAYKAWLVKETRTDDITCIVIFLQGLDAPPAHRNSALAQPGQRHSFATGAKHPGRCGGWWGHTSPEARNGAFL